MDPIRNPFAPGAGTPPPHLVGRDVLLETVRIAIARVRNGKPAKSILMVGLRGVGKTVLLDRMRDEAEASGNHSIRIEAPENRSLPAILAPQLRQALLRLSRNKRAKDLAERALRGLAGFARSLKIKYNDIEVAFDKEEEPGLADNGDLEHDLVALLEVAGEAAKQGDTALVLFVDELQYVAEDELAALITALHRTAQRQLPIVLVGAGLPQLIGHMGNAKSYAERLFDFPIIGALDEEAASKAIRTPIEDEDAKIKDDALALIIMETQCYPYFLQEWGKHAWEAATTSPITKKDVQSASITAVAALDQSFFRVRFDRLTPSEKVYLRAMAELGPGPHRSGDIADMIKKEVSALGPRRAQLITKGMIWSPNHGDTAFTVPLFDEFMKRVMPGEDWLKG
ncbi:MAG: ATP-binding protein [Flavobacteriales bacterium]|nr:ATP-binding protein [Flavobacteriales bacterium]